MEGGNVGGEVGWCRIEGPRFTCNGNRDWVSSRGRRAGGSGKSLYEVGGPVPHLFTLKPVAVLFCNHLCTAEN